MNEQVRLIVARLKRERSTYGRITQIAKGAGVTTRTLQNLMNEDNYSPNVATLDKLLAYFRREDRKAERAAK